MAKAYLELGRYKQARASIKRALAIDPGSRVARRQWDRLSDLDDSEILVKDNKTLFYSNKIKTTRYFLEAVIPQYQALLEGGKKQNFDALEITF